MESATWMLSFGVVAVEGQSLVLTNINDCPKDVKKVGDQKQKYWS